MLYLSMRILLQCCLLCMILLSCATGNRESYVNSRGEIQVARCDNDTANSYHFCEVGESNDSLLLILAIDAHGDGNIAVTRIKEACDITSALIVGSDLIKNGYGNFEAAIDELIQDVRSKHTNVGDKVILIGFSGGARMAYTYSVKKPVYGLITLGAGPGGALPNCRYYGIIGLEDFNFIELYQRPEIGQFKLRDFQADYFRGGHMWPPVQELRDGLLFICKGINEGTDLQCNARSRELLALSDSLRSSHILAWKSLEKAYQLAIDEERGDILESAKVLAKDNAFRVRVENLEKFLEIEYNLRQEYVDMSMKADLDYWKSEIVRINEQIAFSSNTLQIEHNKRIKGFLGILFYSRLQKLSQKKGNERLKLTLLQAFAMIEPKNPDMFYFKSLYFSTVNEIDSASYYLEMSKRQGLKE